MVAVFALMRCLRFERDSKLGMPSSLGIVLGKLSMNDSGDGTEEAMVAGWVRVTVVV
jgi:hypothetical protein